MRNTKILSLTQMAMMAVVIAICSWLSIPTVIPFTLQTFAVFLTLLLLGGMKGTVTVLVYILLGAVGVPVFANFSGGAGVLVGPTGGYIWGFLLTGLIYWAAEKMMAKDSPKLVMVIQNIALLLGLAACYAFGTLFFVWVKASQGSTFEFVQALGLCVFPYILPDLAKLVCANLLAITLKKVLKIR